MERLYSENLHHSHDHTHYRPDDEVARITDRRLNVFSRLYLRGLAGLGNRLVAWGSRLQQRHDTLLPARTKGNPTPC
jgi:hypothetical protein